MRRIFGLALLGSTMDNLSTWICLTHRGRDMEEANPLTAAGIEHFGLTEFLLVQWVLHMGLLTACYFLPDYDNVWKVVKRSVYVTWAVLRWTAALNNLVKLYIIW